MNKHLISLLEASRIPKELYELAIKDDADETEVASKLQEYKDTQVQYWKDKHPEYTPEKIASLEKKFRDEGTMKSARLLAEALGISKKDVEGKTFEEVREILKEAKGKPDPVADEWKTKATTLEAELAKINNEVIPAIHNEYKSKEIESERSKRIMSMFDAIPVIDDYKTDFPDIVSKRIASVGIDVKYNPETKSIEFYDKDGTKAKNKAGKDMSQADFIEVVKPTLKGYIKESNGEPDPKNPKLAGEPATPASKRLKTLQEHNEKVRKQATIGQ
jgi:hypothetical protein